MSIDEGEDAGAGEESSDKKLAGRVQQTSKKVGAQFVVGLVIVPVLLILFVVGLLNLVSFNKMTKELALKEPDNLGQVFSVRIDAAQNEAERQYAEHLDKMANGEIFEVSKKFITLYETSLASEKDYTRLLSTYQQLSYESASRVKGSGEWYFYYKEKIQKLSDAALKREEALITYLGDD
ncbi:MAG: hypothetical protein V7459_02350 [Oceanicoccus sp.]